MEFALTAPLGADDSYRSGYAGGVGLWDFAPLAWLAVYRVKFARNAAIDVRASLGAPLLG